jgi:hypothetical protein
MKPRSKAGNCVQPHVWVVERYIGDWHPVFSSVARERALEVARQYRKERSVFKVRVTKYQAMTIGGKDGR